VDTGVAIAEQGPVPEPVGTAVDDLEAELPEEAKGLLYLRRPPVRRWHPGPVTDAHERGVVLTEKLLTANFSRLPLVDTSSTPWQI